MSAKTDRANRDLAALERTGSTNRVLNLIAVEREHGRSSEYAAAPFFEDRTLNRSLVLKHRLRAYEIDVFHGARHTATKIIIPFASDDLKLGARSVFVGQPGWIDLVREVCGDKAKLQRDLQLLECLDELPSLDPFLLRERIKARGFRVAQCYFALSAADLSKMQSFVSLQIRDLIDLACGAAGPDSANSSARLVNALLSSEADERLEPLRRTLMLEGDAYREGVFSWRGFLYYKWVLTSLQPSLAKIVQEMAGMELTGPPDPEAVRYIDLARQRLRRSIVDELKRIGRMLSVYDEAFIAMTERGDPQSFVRFLRHAPDMFVDLGERIGTASHIASFWRYRFPAGRPVQAPIEEAQQMFKDFEAGLALELAA